MNRSLESKCWNPEVREWEQHLSFITNCQKSNDKYTDFKIPITEIKNSETCLIHVVQIIIYMNFPLVHYYLHEVKTMHFVTLKNEDNIIKMEIKITLRDAAISFLYSIVLPNKCQFLKLLIDSVHYRNNCYAGIKIIQSLIRENLEFAKKP